MLSPLKPFKLIRRFKLVFLSFITCFLCLLLAEPLRSWGHTAPEMAQAVSPSDRNSSEKRVLVSEVVVQGVTGKLQDIVYQTAATKPGRVTTRSQLQTDINAIFKTGWFSNVKAVPEDTPRGVRVTFEVKPNPVLRRINIVPVPESKSVLPTAVMNDIFRSQYGTILNLETFQAGIHKLNQWYQNNGYVLAKVVGQPKISMDGTVTLQIAEGIIESLQVQFVNSENKLVNATGQPVVGKTPTAVILQAIESKPGMVFNQTQIQKGLKQILSLSSVKDATVAWEIPKNSRNVILIVKVQEAVSASAEAENTDRIIQAEAALQRARAQKDPFAEAIAQRTLFDLQMATGKQSDVDRYQIALKRAQTSRDRAGEAEALKGLAYSYNKDANQTNNSSTANNQPSFDEAKKKQAISAYQAALRIYQALNNDAQSAIVLNNIGFIFQELENYPSAIAAYRQAAPLFQKLKHPFWQALTLSNLATSYREIGEIDQSLTAHQQALLVWRFLRDHPDQLQSASLLASVNQPDDRQSQIVASWGGSSRTGFQGNLKFYIGTSDLRKSNLADVRLGEATTLLNIGGIYQVVGDYQQALYTFKTVLPLLQIPSTIQSLIENSSQKDREVISEFMPELIDAGGDFLMSTLYTDMGWQQQAQTYRDRASTKGRLFLEKIARKIAIANTQEPELNSLLPVMSLLFNHLISSDGSNSSTDQFNQMLIDSFNQSVPLLQQFIAKQPEYKTQWQPFLPWMDVFYNYTQGEELAKANKFQQAAVVYRQALTQWKKLSPRDLQSATVHVDFHTTGTNFTGTSTLKSLGILPLVLEIFGQAGYVYHAKTYTALGKTLLALGKPQEAIEAHQQAVQILQTGRDQFSKTPARTQPTNALDQFVQPLWTRFWAKTPDEATADAFFQLGKTYAANRQYSEALESYRRALPLWRKANTSLQETYWEMAIVQRQQGNLTQAKTQIETAIDQLEQGGEFQTSYELQKLNSANPKVPQKPSLYKSYLNLADYLASKHNYYGFYIDLLMQLHQQSPTAGYAELAFQASERSHARSLRALLNGAVRPDAANSSTSVQAMQLAQPLPLKDLQRQLLDDKTLLLEYALGKDRSYLWAVTPKGLQTYTLPKQADIEAIARDWIELLQSPIYQMGDRRSAAPSTSTVAVQVDAAAQLSRMLLEPVAAQLGNKRLLIVSDGILHYLPFAALPQPGTGEKNQPLFVDHEIIGLPSAALRIGLQQRANAKAPTQTLAILADPIFSRDDRRLQQSSRTSDAEILYERLPGTRQEASEIAKLVPPAKRLLKLDAAASRRVAISPELAQYRIVHFASHGTLNSQNPERSGMVLSIVDDQGKLQRSLLSTADAFNLKLSADLVVLSGCTTALGKEIQGEGLIGLTGGLMYAGTKQVIAGLWNVDDDSTALLMTQLYQGMLHQGLSPAAALRAAQLKLWQSQKWQAPYHWAAFALQGS